MAAKRHDETQRAKDAPRYDFSFTQNRELSWICFDERVLDENRNVDISKAQPITFDPFNNTYVVLGETVAKAFSAGNSLK